MSIKEFCTNGWMANINDEMRKAPNLDVFTVKARKFQILKLNYMYNADIF